MALPPSIQTVVPLRSSPTTYESIAGASRTITPRPPTTVYFSPSGIVVEGLLLFWGSVNSASQSYRR